ncbi:MAG: FdtA/QdtA family cupin domain-containing protein [bacterium]|nr:FdtA/QdtA family cupin domain-containing protein [bacterium]
MHTIKFAPKGDERGWLVALEAQRQVPFDIQRVYYIYGTQPGVRRGKHAHRHLRQLAICLHGSCRFFMDDGRHKQKILLNRNDQGLLIEPMVWHEMDDFSVDCVLLVLASRLYDERDYIRDYASFREELIVQPKLDPPYSTL